MKLDAEPRIALREVTQTDVDIFFEHQLDPQATKMAALPSRPREVHRAHWAKVLADTTALSRTITRGGRVAGNIGSWEREGKRLVGYWIARDLWGKGIATAALSQFLDLDPTRPLYAHVAAHNAGSLRVLEKCGFESIGRQVEEDGIEEVALILRA